MHEIKTDEFEQERHIFEMWRWINTKIVEMELSEDFDQVYFRQVGKNVKKLIEEAIPIAHLGLSFVAPMVDVHACCLTGNQPYDGTLRLTGFRNFEIKVEVTTTQTEETVFARHELADKGTVFRPAEFELIGKDKVAKPVRMVEMGEQYEEWIKTALNAASKKITSGKYSPDTAILVRVDTWSELPHHERAELVRRTREKLSDHLALMHGIYYLHGRAVDVVRNRSSAGPYF